MTRCCLEARSFTPKSVVPNSKPEYRSVQTNTAAGEREGDSCAVLMLVGTVTEQAKVIRLLLVLLQLYVRRLTG